MKLLLDTHILLWSLLDASKIGKHLAGELERADNELWLSPLTVWEVIVLSEKRRVVLEPDPVTWIRDVLSTIPFQEAMVNHEVTMRSRLIRLPHGDPVDRFLAATAAVYELTLVTTDERLLRSRECSTLPNR